MCKTVLPLQGDANTMQALCSQSRPWVYCAAARQAAARPPAAGDGDAARPPTLHRRSSAACSFTASFPASSSAGHGHGELHPDGDGGGVDGAELGLVREEADAAEVWATPSRSRSSVRAT
jgi:hypothetical protein